MWTFWWTLDSHWCAVPEWPPFGCLWHKETAAAALETGFHQKGGGTDCVVELKVISRNTQKCVLAQKWIIYISRNQFFNNVEISINFCIIFCKGKSYSIQFRELAARLDLIIQFCRFFAYIMELLSRSCNLEKKLKLVIYTSIILKRI